MLKGFIRSTIMCDRSQLKRLLLLFFDSVCCVSGVLIQDRGLLTPNTVLKINLTQEQQMRLD